MKSTPQGWVGLVMDRQGLPYGGNACQRDGYRSRPVAAFPALPRESRRVRGKGSGPGYGWARGRNAKKGDLYPGRNGEESPVYSHIIPRRAFSIKWTLGVFMRNYEGNAARPGPVHARRRDAGAAGTAKGAAPRRLGWLAGRRCVRRCPGRRRGLPSRCRRCRAWACRPGSGWRCRTRRGGPGKWPRSGRARPLRGASRGHR